MDGALGFLLLALWIHAVIDVVRADESQVRHLPKMTWLFVVISLPDIGALIWRVAGRPEQPARRFEDYIQQRPRRALGPEYREDFTAWFEQTRSTNADAEDDDGGRGRPDSK
jgi:Phospholipase_D-nuclease N-terminal